MAFLADRRADTVTACLRRHPAVKVVSRDGFTGFRKGITDANPSIKQIYDRFHFIRNAKKQLDAFVSSLVPAQIAWTESGSQTEPPVSLTPAEQQAAERRRKKWEFIRNIQEEHHRDKNISQLKREYNLDWRTVRGYLKMKAPPSWRRQRTRNTNPFTERMIQLEEAGYTVKEIFSSIQEEGYTGTYSGVRTVIENLRRERKQRIARDKTQSLSKRCICQWMWKHSSHLTSEEEKIFQRVLRDYPALSPAYHSIQKYRKAIEERNPEGLIEWLRSQLASKKQPFYYYAFRLKSDLHAVRNAILYPFSNGLLEGQVNRLKTIKRMTYGRAGLSLLEKRVLYQL